ncbi:MAG: MarR family winged helix-turn-helix transcriptional regulator [Nocardioides sp.]
MAMTEHPDLGILMALAYEEFVSGLREHLASLGYEGLGRADGFVFRTLDDGPMTVSDLAIRLGVTKQGAAQIIDDMQARGLVRRGRDPHDARARPVELTGRGRDALNAASGFHQRTEQGLVEIHGADAVATLRTLLTSIIGPAASPAAPHFRIGVL